MDARPLYRAVYRRPADDAVRLVLADALMEDGDPRGEFIALQLKTHALARKRASKLLQRHRAHFLGELNETVVHGSDVWHRGFLVSAHARLTGDRRECRDWSTVRELTVLGDGRWPVHELASPHMASLERVWLAPIHDDWQGPREVARLRERVRDTLHAAGRSRLEVLSRYDLPRA